jgi:hypothetical protein
MFDSVLPAGRAMWRERKGSVLVEWSILMPFLLTLGFGVFEFGNMLYKQHLVETGLKDAARYLARVPDPVARQQIGKEIAVMGEVGGTNKRVSFWNVSDVSVSITTIANPIDATTNERTYRGPDPIPIVRVSTTASYPTLGFLGYLGLGNTITFSLYHEERVIGE